MLATRLAVVLFVGASCAALPAPAPTRTAPAAFVIPTDLPNGRAEITIAAAYPIGKTMTIPIAISVTRGTIIGPITARVLASGINEGSSPAEVVVSHLAVSPITVTSGRGTTKVTWDTRDQQGALVPADAYSLVLEFRSDTGAINIAKAGATLELR